MARWIVMGAAASLVAACGSFSGMGPVDPPREVLGVSAPQTGPADAPGEQAVGMVQWKISQICTRGYLDPREEIEPAADERQLVDWQFRCAPYRLWALDFVPEGMWPF